MKLYPPLKRAKYFGWDHELKNLSDFNRCITQGFGERPEYYGPNGHNGIDVSVPVGTPIYASHDGEAAGYEERDEHGNFKGYGRYISVRNREQDFKTEYCHLDKVVKTGQVKARELIGISGNTGNSTGPHLHYVLKAPKAINPMPYLVWFDHMSEQEVMALQSLEGYSDPEGVTFWTGKTLGEYLKARLLDKVKEIQKAQNELS